MTDRWKHLLPYDPFYNRHFSRDRGIYRELRVLEPEDEVRMGESTSFLQKRSKKLF
jgi:hypothetical protein